MMDIFLDAVVAEAAVAAVMVVDAAAVVVLLYSCFTSRGYSRLSIDRSCQFNVVTHSS